MVLTVVRSDVDNLKKTFSEALTSIYRVPLTIASTVLLVNSIGPIGRPGSPGHDGSSGDNGSPGKNY